MSIKKLPSGTVIDCVDPEDKSPPPAGAETEDGDITTPKSQAPTEDDQPLD